MSNGKKLPHIHLWVYNHPLAGISDQVEFFFLIMQQHGYRVSMSRKPRLDALNVVIENFSEATSQTLIDFCERTGKRVALIMTEHLDLQGGELFIHGEPLWNDNDYMHPVTQVARIKNLMDCLPCLRALWVLGDLPQLIGSERMFPGIPVRALPFPSLARVEPDINAPQYDFVFTGALTAFRKQILTNLSASHSLTHTTHFLPRKGRDQLNTTARIVLNIPQRPDWRWLSLMRIIAALRCGRATVSIGSRDTSAISHCCFQLDEAQLPQRLGELLSNWPDSYAIAHERYQTMQANFTDEHGFPADLIEYWALLERKWLS
ncbi:hypothetical protein [Pseudomonas piscis]|uniref:Glycosyltransferase family 1 protein n=1 Tax=Pseudomonas piscis TaxID=2614538 RepID=A0A7X1PGF6_9PSED|nr:hypothetical protein [Pseudomonas piscis]MQA51739.1 hypothetical protein [Pseudomonas piscis]